MGTSRRFGTWIERVCVAAFAASAARCEGSYTLPPTACDDWCFATQRAGCSEDYPEGCVSECEDESIGRRHPQCEAPWIELGRCYRDAPSSAFRCVEGESTPMNVCFDERIAVLDCVDPLLGVCMQACLAQAAGCGRFGRNCEERCSSPTPDCQREELAFYACQIEGPADCQDPETDTRPAQEIPCFREIEDLLTCAGFEGP
jgi:hypothetical protein